VRQRCEQHDRLRVSELPLFELESWLGAVGLAGWGGPPDKITHISVGFCNENDPAPVVSVTTVANEAGHEDWMRERLLGELSGRGLERRTGPSPSPEPIRNALDQARNELRSLSWKPVAIRIDGRDHEVFAVQGPQGFAAYCTVGDLWVTIF